MFLIYNNSGKVDSHVSDACENADRLQFSKLLVGRIDAAVHAS